jgi:hypothetical protein
LDFVTIRNRCLIAVAVLSTVYLLIPLSASAKPKKKTFDNASGIVFQAALRTARERHVVTFVDEKNLMLTFETGTSALSYGFVANASVEAETDDKSTLIINVQHKNSGKNSSFSFNAGERMTDKFYEQVAEELVRHPSQKAAQKSESDHVAIPTNSNGTDGKPLGNSPASQSSAEVGSISVSSSPEGADVSVDAAFVGNSPAILKLPAGKHTISVTLDGFKNWTRDLTVLPGADTKLNASLSKQ